MTASSRWREPFLARNQRRRWRVIKDKLKKKKLKKGKKKMIKIKNKFADISIQNIVQRHVT